MKTVLYIHGFNGNPKGGTYDGLANFFKDKPDFRLISFPFPDLHTDVEKTQCLIEKYIDENSVSILVGASLGGFYSLCCKKAVYKIAINPCMLPSKEIFMLKDLQTGEPVEIDPAVQEKWESLEKYDLDLSMKNAFGIFGKADKTFHYGDQHNYSPLFEKLFSANTILVEGKHSLDFNGIYKGMDAAIKKIKI